MSRFVWFSVYILRDMLRFVGWLINTPDDNDVLINTPGDDDV